MSAASPPLHEAEEEGKTEIKEMGDSQATLGPELPREIEVPPGNTKAKAPGGIDDVLSEHAKGGRGGTKGTFWMITDQKPGHIDHKVLSKDQKYKIYQSEICPKTGKEHIQLYVEYKKQVNFATVRRDFTYASGGSAHIEVKSRKSTREQCKKYCSKEASRKPGTTPTEVGTWDEQAAGRRSDLREIGAKILAGASIQEILLETPHSVIQYGKGIREAIGEVKLMKAALRNVKTTCFIGPPGVGKDLLAQVMAKKLGYFMITFRQDKEWFDGYKGERCLIISEYKNQLPRPTLLDLLDHGKKMIAVKGGMILAEWTDVFITSNFQPEKWYDNELKEYKDYDYTALQRRLTLRLDYNHDLNTFDESLLHREERNMIYKDNKDEQRNGDRLIIKVNIGRFKEIIGAKIRQAEGMEQEYLSEIQDNVIPVVDVVEQ